MKRILSILILLFPLSVAAQTGLTGFNGQTTITNFDGTGILNTIGSKPVDAWRSSMGAQVGLLYKPITANSLAGAGSDAIVEQIVTDFNYALGLPFNTTVGVDAPVIFDQRGQNVVTGAKYTSNGVGDMILSSKWCFLCSFLDEEDLRGWAAAVASRTFIPTGTTTEFTGSSGPTQDFLLTVEKKWAAAELEANVGYRLAPHDVFVGGEHDDEYLFSTAVRFPLKAINGTWAFIGDAHGSVLQGDRRKANSPTQAMAGFEKSYPDGIRFDFGFGERFFSALAAPHHQAFFGVHYTYK